MPHHRIHVILSCAVLFPVASLYYLSRLSLRPLTRKDKEDQSSGAVILCDIQGVCDEILQVVSSIINSIIDVLKCDDCSIM